MEVAQLEDGSRRADAGCRAAESIERHEAVVFGNDKTQQARLVAVLDNLGKGAGGAAVQNLNLMLGLPETAGLL